MKIEKEIIKKILHGDTLSDDELSEAIKFYNNMEEGLVCLGTPYYLARADITITVNRLKSYQWERKNRRHIEKSQLDHWKLKG